MRVRCYEVFTAPAGSPAASVSRFHEVDGPAHFDLPLAAGKFKAGQEYDLTLTPAKLKPAKK
jgi:hypothetical protein